MPNLDDPFCQAELRGFFTWDADLTEDLATHDPWFYTAMHEAKLRKGIRLGKLIPKSSFNVEINEESQPAEPCVWFAMQDWSCWKSCNHFGPFVVRIKLRELEQRRFYVYERGRIKSWKRFYFVQREERTALFSTPAKRIDPRTLFKHERNGSYTAASLTQYEIVATESVSLANAKVEATAHEWCGAGVDHCYARLDRRSSVEKLSEILGHELMPETGPRRFPKPFALRKVIPPHRLPKPRQASERMS
jgi:hypothetical protein